MESTAVAPYPARLNIEYQAAHRRRLTVVFRLFAAIPAMVLLGAIENGILVIPVLLMVVFRRKYPGWWFDFNREYERFSTRVIAYLVLLSDDYPSTDEEQAVRLDLDYPDAGRDLNRWLPLVKWLLAIPHYLALFVLAVAALAATIWAWFVVVFTGRYPEGIHRFVVGVMRWSLRVQAYAFLMLTDRYPPFSLEE